MKKWTCLGVRHSYPKWYWIRDSTTEKERDYAALLWLDDGDTWIKEDGYTTLWDSLAEDGWVRTSKPIPEPD
jgi:hypothetical protein